MGEKDNEFPYKCIMCEQQEATETVEETIRGDVREFSVCGECQTEIEAKRSAETDTDRSDDEEAER